MKLRVAYATEYDASDIRQWSGIGFHMAAAMAKAGLEVQLMGPLVEKWHDLFRGRQLACKTLTGKRHLRDREPVILRQYAKQLARKLEDGQYDIVFSPGTVCTAYLQTAQPVIFWTDATFAAMINFYPQWTNLCRATLRNGHALERRAIARADLAIYSSQWAADSALEVYGANPSKIHVVPFGANMPIESTMSTVASSVGLRPRDRCRLLFIGADWERKGGPLAVAVTEALNDAGLPTELTIVGCRPSLPRSRDRFISAGFIDKSTVVGRKRLADLFAASHFLLLPAVADCTPVAFSEANGFGVPVLTTNVGGIATVIRDRENGLLLPRDRDAYRDRILSAFEDYAAYVRLALSSFTEYKNRLNWDSSVGKVSRLMQGLATG